MVSVCVVDGAAPVKSSALVWKRPSPNRRVESPWPKSTSTNTQTSPSSTGYDTRLLIYICINIYKWVRKLKLNKN